MNIDEAKKIAGKLSHTSKMPCASWGIPAKYCETGGHLRKIPGTVCEKCYAHKGSYNYPNVKSAGELRYKGITHPKWAEAMVVLIKDATKLSVPYFRWFDSGDLQGEKHLDDIVWIAEQLPIVKFWLPTHELDLVRGRKFPENLTVRVSAVMMGDAEPKYELTSTVVKEGATCLAGQQENQCLDLDRDWETSCP